MRLLSVVLLTVVWHTKSKKLKRKDRLPRHRKTVVDYGFHFLVYSEGRVKWRAITSIFYWKNNIIEKWIGYLVHRLFVPLYHLQIQKWHSLENNFAPHLNLSKQRRQKMYGLMSLILTANLNIRNKKALSLYIIILCYIKSLYHKLYRKRRKVESTPKNEHFQVPAWFL